MAQLYVKDTDWPWPLLVDEDRTLYRAYGMESAKLWDLMGPAAMWKYIKLMARGNLPKRPTGDIYQRGGDVLIDPEGMVRVHHVGSGPADRPEVSDLLDAVREGKRKSSGNCDHG